jgi:hypothetical protein
MLGAAGPALAVDYKDKVKIEISSAELQAGMAPGQYACAAGHLHIKGTVLNQAGVALGRIKVAGKALGADGKVLGTATAFARAASLGLNEKADIDLEFPSVMGPALQKVAKHEVVVVEAPPKK